MLDDVRPLIPERAPQRSRSPAKSHGRQGIGGWLGESDALVSEGRGPHAARLSSNGTLRIS